MGACFDCFITDKDPKVQYEHECEMARYESGSSYSGRINMTSGLTIEEKIFNSQYEAEEYVSNNAQKWENAIAVRFKDDVSFKPTKPYLKLKQNITNLTETLALLNQYIKVKLVKQLKSKEFVTCKNCKSRMDTRFVKNYHNSTKCPICHVSLMSQTDANKIIRLNEKIVEKRKKLDDLTKVLRKKAEKNSTRKLYWLVGGTCSS